MSVRRTRCFKKGVCFKMSGRRRQCYTRTQWFIKKCNVGPPEAMLQPDAMLLKESNRKNQIGRIQSEESNRNPIGIVSKGSHFRETISFFVNFTCSGSVVLSRFFHKHYIVSFLFVMYNPYEFFFANPWFTLFRWLVKKLFESQNCNWKISG